jgi:hypothetical protein
MPKPIADKAEVSIDFPDKFYMGSFAKESRFDVTADPDGVHLWIERLGDERRKVGLHLHYYLLAGVLDAMADAVSSDVTIGKAQRRHLASAAGRLESAFAAGALQTEDKP